MPCRLTCAEPRQQQEDGAIPYAVGRTHIAGVDETLDVRRFEVARQSRELPLRDSGQGLIKVGLTPSLRRKKPQKGSQSSDKHLGVGAAQRTDCLEEDVAHQNGIVDGGIMAERREHSCDETLIALDGPLRDATMTDHPGAERYQRCRDRPRRRPSQGWYDSQTTEIRRKLPDPCHVASGRALTVVGRVGALAMVLGEPGNGCLAELIHADVTRIHPAAKVCR